MTLLCAGWLAQGCAGMTTTTCVGDDCTVSGPGAAEIQERERRMAEFREKVEALPRRGVDEQIVIGIAMPVSANKSVAAHAAAYHQMLMDAFAEDPDFRVLSWAEIRKDVQSLTQQGSPGTAQYFRNDKTPVGRARKQATDALFARAFKGDVIVFSELSVETKSGIVAGRRGGGIVTVEHVNIALSASSVYRFEEHRLAETGKSTGGFSAGGVVDGRVKSGRVGGTRDLEKDREAVRKLVAAMKSRIGERVRPGLPGRGAYEALLNEQMNPLQRGLLRAFRGG